MPVRTRTAALLVTAVMASSVVAPSTASPSPYVAYELRRVRGSGSGGELRVRVEGRPVGGPGLYVHAVMRPTRTGYEERGFGVVQYADPGTETRTYGWPAAANPCPVVPVCLRPDPTGKITSMRTFKPARGDRIFIVGVRGQITITPLTPGWVVRPASLGFRVVTADRADTTGAYVAGLHVERFRAATAPGGRHGSLAFADVPCESGSAVLSSGAGESRTFDCEGGGLGMGGEATRRGRRWTVEGDTFGSHGLPFRLVVLDYPA